MKSATARPRWSVPNDIGALTRSRPRGSDLQARHREIGFLEIGQDGDAALVIGLPVLGRAGAAGGADQKLRAELLLQLDHVFAHGRARQAQLPRRGREAAVLHHPGEGPDAGQLVHGVGPEIVLKSETQTP